MKPSPGPSESRPLPTGPSSLAWARSREIRGTHAGQSLCTDSVSGQGPGCACAHLLSSAGVLTTRQVSLSAWSAPHPRAQINTGSRVWGGGSTDKTLMPATCTKASRTQQVLPVQVLGLALVIFSLCYFRRNPLLLQNSVTSNYKRSVFKAVVSQNS